MKEGIIAGGGVEDNDPKLAPFVDRVQYHAMNFDDAAGYDALKKKLAELDGSSIPRATGCSIWRPRRSTSPTSSTSSASTAWRSLSPMRGRQGAWVRTIIEKPFGHDLESARALNDEVNKVFNEDQIFRIDHYLGKETVQNILVFRFANGIFENVWNRNYIDHVEITAAESIGIEGRGPFYEQAGALRDVVQNHVMELLSFVAMEPPVSFQADAVRAEKVKVWKAISADSSCRHGARAVWAGHRGRQGCSGLSAGRPRASALADRDLCRAAAGDRELALGRRAVLHPRGQAAGKARDRDHGPVQAAAAAAVQGQRVP